MCTNGGELHGQRGVSTDGAPPSPPGGSRCDRGRAPLGRVGGGRPGAVNDEDGLTNKYRW